MADLPVPDGTSSRAQWVDGTGPTLDRWRDLVMSRRGYLQSAR